MKGLRQKRYARRRFRIKKSDTLYKLQLVIALINLIIAVIGLIKILFFAYLLCGREWLSLPPVLYPFKKFMSIGLTVVSGLILCFYTYRKHKKITVLTIIIYLIILILLMVRR